MFQLCFAELHQHLASFKHRKEVLNAVVALLLGAFYNSTMHFKILSCGKLDGNECLMNDLLYPCNNHGNFLIIYSASHSQPKYKEDLNQKDLVGGLFNFLSFISSEANDQRFLQVVFSGIVFQFNCQCFVRLLLQGQDTGPVWFTLGVRGFLALAASRLSLVFRLGYRSAPRWAVCPPNFRQVARCKEIQDSLGFWFPRHGFRILGAKFRILCQVNLDSGFQPLVGFLIFLAVFWIPKPRIPDSTSKNFPDPGIWIHLRGATQGIRPPKEVLICENDRKRRIQNHI